MIDKILNIKNKSKILYYIIFPLVIIAFIAKFLMENNISGAKKDLKKAEEKDAALKAEQDRLEAESEKAKAEADGHKDKAEDLENDKPSVGEDWHLND